MDYRVLGATTLAKVSKRPQAALEKNYPKILFEDRLLSPEEELFICNGKYPPYNLPYQDKKSSRSQNSSSRK
jgi:hypothetical protein